MRSNRRWIGIAAIAALPGMPLAETTADALTRIEAETLLLKARERQLEVQSNILSKQNEIALKQGTGATVAHFPPGSDTVVRAIEGLGGRMYATLQTRDGSTVDVEPGTVLSDGTRVVSIRSNEVLVRDPSGKTGRLAMADRAAPGNAAGGSGTAGYPPIPPLPPAPPRGPAR
ncbi:MAG TPA: type IV pilus biogenesis protein PilP [Noviherbaspirillum sp.]|jgi:type IV pilus biogenesis protein PilP|uniref:type IV pilus biogenesis protein PilP n=1 Tax=Noviherbaspirillum sp. TaxID=1926288 RepID=UPI002F924A67